MPSFETVGNPLVTAGGHLSNHNILLFPSNSDFIISHLILTPLSSCRRPVPLQEEPCCIQHRGRSLQSHAPLRLLKGEQIAQQVLPVCAGRSSHQPEPWRPQIHQCQPCICQGNGWACLPFDSRIGSRSWRSRMWLKRQSLAGAEPETQTDSEARTLTCRFQV